MKIVGHRPQIQHLQHLVQADKLPHALLFTGTEGIGKRLVALQLIQNLFCGQKSFDGSACGECRDCQRVAQGSHPDCLAIAPESNLIKTEVIRQLKQKFSLKPLEAPYKVVLIDDAQCLHASAANVLLKTLEEPPEKALMILITPSPYKLLRTILSRCQKLGFSPLGLEEMRAVMEALDQGEANAESLGLAQGSPGMYLKLSQEAFDLVKNSLLPSLEKQPKDLMKLLEIAEKLSKEESLAESVLKILLLQWSQGAPSLGSLDHAAKTEAIYEAARKFKDTHANPQLTFENLFLKLCL